MLKNYGQYVNKSRIDKKMTLRDVYDKSGIPPMTISNWEHGSVPPVDKLDKVLKALGVSIVIGKKGE